MIQRLPFQGNCFHENLFDEVRFFHSVGCADCLGAGGKISGQTEEPFYPPVVSFPQVCAIFLEWESILKCMNHALNIQFQPDNPS